MVVVLTVFFEGLEFYAHHGVPAEERTIGHRYCADLYMELSKEPKSDDVNATVDYADSMGYVQRFATENQFRTMEALAMALADNLLAEYPNVRELTLKIAKIAPPTPFIVEHAGVEITRTR